ncbi:MAG: response regulator [Undibacterium sp.]|uniref:response regulator n=1 Tax=Undibacterium sp. TaxID=1914977 RepID=UPI002727997F|nr:response regulator [Undibacterium sp.]MDO8651457.1 response regulator [Undibacterium sp.]
MNQSNPVVQSQSGSRRFVVDMIGFSDAEKSMLASTFRLTGRRAYAYVEPTDEDQRADIYLINADQPEAMAAMQERAPNVHSPAVIIGRNAVSAGWPFVQKPIHWMRLFEHLDELMQAALLERSLREQQADSQWDGQTYRRSIDKKSLADAVFLPPRSTESVLVVDDSATVRAFMRIKLAPFHFDVDYAENGEQAIDMAQAKSYTCIFLDIMMPGIDGYEVCKRIKANADTKQTAVVMLSSKSSMFDKFRGNWAGCDAYLGKPVAEDDLLATIARFLPSARA